MYEIQFINKQNENKIYMLVATKLMWEKLEKD